MEGGGGGRHEGGWRQDLVVQDVMGILDKEGKVGVGVLREEVAWEGLEGDDGGKAGAVEMLGLHRHHHRHHSHLHTCLFVCFLVTDIITITITN